MIICAAQIKPLKGDIPANIRKHSDFIGLAANSGADAVFFPELSLTGYEPELAKGLATTADDKMFDVFQHLSDRENITIGAGMPILSENGIRISMLIFQPGTIRTVYSKQQLHDDELPYFIPGTEQMILQVSGTRIAPAICYESLQPEHAANAQMLGAELYLASVAKSQNGINKAVVHYSDIAKKYNMPVLMANAVGFCDNFLSVGYSSVWTNQGELLARLDDLEEALLGFDIETGAVFRRSLLSD